VRVGPVDNIDDNHELPYITIDAPNTRCNALLDLTSDTILIISIKAMILIKNQNWYIIRS